MKELKAINTKAREWISKISTKIWCKYGFSFYPKCDIIMNNVFEAFNNTILVARDKLV